MLNETISFQREPLLSREFGLASKSGDELTEDGAIDGASIGSDKPCIFHLPVGVRQTSNAEISNDIPNGRLDSLSKTKNHTATQALPIPNGSGIIDVPSTLNRKYANVYKKQGILSARATSMLVNRKYANGYKKQGILSARATSMLEAERDSETKWNRLLEIGYKGGTYKGHYQGGLPEGRGDSASNF